MNQLSTFDFSCIAALFGRHFLEKLMVWSIAKPASQ